MRMARPVLICLRSFLRFGKLIPSKVTSPNLSRNCKTFQMSSPFISRSYLDFALRKYGLNSIFFRVLSESIKAISLPVFLESFTLNGISITPLPQYTKQVSFDPHRALQPSLQVTTWLQVRSDVFSQLQVVGCPKAIIGTAFSNNQTTKVECGRIS